VFLTIDQVDVAHERVIEAFGGLPGKRDDGLVASAVIAPQSGFYTSLAEMASVYAFGLAKNHGYVDANKRVAALAIRLFLAMNGVHVAAGERWHSIIEGVAAGSVRREELRIWITSLMGGDPVELEE